MLRKYPSIFGMTMVRLFDIEMSIDRPITDAKDFEESKTAALDPEQIKSMTYTVFMTRLMAMELEMEAVLPLIERIEQKIKQLPYLQAEAHRHLEDLSSRIKDALQQRYFLYVPPEFERYYAHPPLFGSEVESRFPAAIDDIDNAGKCLALGQGTACVMHLMRVIEVGLKALGAALKIPYAPSWESYLNQIQAKIGAKHKTKSIKWKRDEKFFRDVSGDLISIKQAWRNPSMHIDRRFAKEEAEEIFKAVKTFMLNLAKKLPS
jgi:hypothetical protein